MSVPAQELSEVHDVLTNSNLPSTCRGQPKTIAIVCNVYKQSWSTLTNKSKHGFSSLVLCFLLGGLSLLEGALLIKMRAFYLNCIWKFIDRLVQIMFLR